MAIPDTTPTVAPTPFTAPGAPAVPDAVSKANPAATPEIVPTEPGSDAEEITPTPTPPPKPLKVIPKVAPLERQEIFGHSVKGRPLLAYVLGEGTNVTVIFGAFHGNETNTASVVERLREYLKQHPETLAGCRIILVPKVNPDGLAMQQRVNAHGVDLNRNFPGSWQPRVRRMRYSPGPRAASEPETQGVMQLLKKYKPGKVVSIHSPFHTMNWTGERSRTLAFIMQQYNKYPTTDNIGYPTPGSLGNYCGRVLQIAIITLELPIESASLSWQANREALLAAIAHRF
ncbi:MAG: DUF2817 domain-containing protein [Abitibacteriaceae bacterium]|nr:DUF2817 domain-containing protein [Abditibacteriaceae bacterium]MBV9863822.1 DUF2817 domain-containing protein [Abditibacteriaceae bacterium]